MRSTYMWEGDLAQAEEYLLVVKSLAERYEAIETMVLDMHPYELPEILYTEVRGGLGGYLDWVAGG